MPAGTYVQVLFNYLPSDANLCSRRAGAADFQMLALLLQQSVSFILDTFMVVSYCKASGLGTLTLLRQVASLPACQTWHVMTHQRSYPFVCWLGSPSVGLRTFAISNILKIAAIS